VPHWNEASGLLDAERRLNREGAGLESRVARADHEASTLENLGACADHEALSLPIIAHGHGRLHDTQQPVTELEKSGMTNELDTCTTLCVAPELSFSAIKQFDFSWAALPGAEFYQLLESPALGEPFVQLGEDIVGESISITMPLHLRVNASYMLRACNADGCVDRNTRV
jgi:hypothetical protein